MGLEVKDQVVECGEGWSGGVHVTLDCARDQAWEIFADFGGLCKWNPAITVCDMVEGKGNEPGSVRYCRGTLPDSWVYERLLVLDKENYLCRYQMEDNRFRFRDGVQGYVSQIQFRDLEKGKTLVNWTYTVHPVATQTREQFTTFMTGFYLYNLNILQSAANARASSLNPAQEQIHRNSAPTCKLLNA
ncbi:hypothetical protein M758_1G081300 [Ceratodon purpureus]|uniref:Uncharacterized protein n=1 Tax=Ceratodon purpureus TaxID=3225 RepID=A0A8T0J2U3_CERPU|nr:hypothetical protein KC19_1G082900 [Ceratodon purpureus]KAG0629160.1 hypothetical protein M758_1G081300 [Ceratodon purpureus]